VSIADTHYLHNVVGDTEVRKGDGMQLDQLIQNTSFSRDTSARIQPFDLDTLKEAFQLRETAPVELPAVRIFVVIFIIPNFLNYEKFDNAFFLVLYRSFLVFLLIGGERNTDNCRKIKK
jgi:hypothetical protein